MVAAAVFGFGVGNAAVAPVAEVVGALGVTLGLISAAALELVAAFGGVALADAPVIGVALAEAAVAGVALGALAAAAALGLAFTFGFAPAFFPLPCPCACGAALAPVVAVGLAAFTPCSAAVVLCAAG